MCRPALQADARCGPTPRCRPTLCGATLCGGTVRGPTLCRWLRRQAARDRPQASGPQWPRSGRAARPRRRLRRTAAPQRTPARTPRRRWRRRQLRRRTPSLRRSNLRRSNLRRSSLRRSSLRQSSPRQFGPRHLRCRGQRRRRLLLRPSGRTLGRPPTPGALRPARRRSSCLSRGTSTARAASPRRLERLAPTSSTRLPRMRPPRKQTPRTRPPRTRPTRTKRATARAVTATTTGPTRAAAGAPAGQRRPCQRAGTVPGPALASRAPASSLTRERRAIPAQRPRAPVYGSASLSRPCRKPRRTRIRQPKKDRRSSPVSLRQCPRMRRQRTTLVRSPWRRRRPGSRPRPGSEQRCSGPALRQPRTGT